MKLRKNPNIQSTILRLDELRENAANLIIDLKKVNQLLDDSKLGINELNYSLDEEYARFKNCYAKIEELFRVFSSVS
jgi:chaperonin cofactor prefoldin